MHDAREYAEAHGHHVTLLLGVVAEHGSEMAEAVLDDLQAWLMAHHEMPLLPHAIQEDCLVAPPERDNVHLEVRWFSL